MHLGVVTEFCQAKRVEGVDVSEKSALFREHEVEAIIRDYLQSQGNALQSDFGTGRAEINGETGRTFLIIVL